MSTTERRTASLPTEHTASFVERWLKEAVAPAFDSMAADPSRGIPAETVFARIKDHHTERLRDPR